MAVLAGKGESEIGYYTPIRWNKDTEEFEYRCESCADKRKSKFFWPLTLEFWRPQNGMRQCVACYREQKAKLERQKRQTNPEYRKKCVNATKEQRKIKGHIYNQTRAKTRKSRSKYATVSDGIL